MSRKNKLTDEQRVKAVQEYLAGNGSYSHIARKYGIAYQSLTEMVLRAQTEGIESIKSGRNRKYSAETRNNAVLDYISGKGSQAEICSKYRIKSKSILRRWISWYNSGKDFKERSRSERGVTMKKGRKTTLEERTEIVAFCIHTINDNPISVSKNLMEELEQKANKIIALTQKGRKVTFTDITRLEKQMLDEIEKSIIEDLPDKKEKSRTAPEDMAKYERTNEKCNEILNANPELKGKLNLATVEYCKKHNIDLPDSSLPADKRYEMRNAILNENPILKEEYIKAKTGFERKQSQSRHQAKPNPKPPKPHR